MPEQQSHHLLVTLLARHHQRCEALAIFEILPNTSQHQRNGMVGKRIEKVAVASGMLTVPYQLQPAAEFPPALGYRSEWKSEGRSASSCRSCWCRPRTVAESCESLWLISVIRAELLLRTILTWLPRSDHCRPQTSEKFGR